MEAEMIDIKHLSKSFGELKVLQNVSFRLEEGKVLVLIGPSGTGKSTLLRCINYLEKPDDGMITIGDITVDAKNHKKNISYVEKQQWFFKITVCSGIKRLCRIL